MKIWKFNESTPVLDSTLDGNWKAGCFDPHHNNLFLTANDMSLQSYDLRTKGYFFIILLLQFLVVQLLYQMLTHHQFVQLIIIQTNYILSYHHLKIEELNFGI